jgi:hypothetical protein
MSVVNTSEGTNDRTAMIRQAFRLEYITLAWMVIEAVVAMDMDEGGSAARWHRRRRHRLCLSRASVR